MGSAEEAKIRTDALEGPKKKTADVTLAEMFTDYIEAKRPRSYLIRAIVEFTKEVGHYRAEEADKAWLAFLSHKRGLMSATTQATARSRYCAALNYSAKTRGIELPPILNIKRDTVIAAVYLSKEEQERLIAAYAEYARPIALTLCFQGLRSGEAIRLDWRYVDFNRRTLFVNKSKNGRQRSVPMHPRVYDALYKVWEQRGRPLEGIVFLNYFGRPFVDRTVVGEGGNPLLWLHTAACKAAGIKSFTPHSWRHHWASWMVMSGCDLFTLMRLGGWSSLAMVQRYAAVSSEHMKDAINRLS